MQQQLLEGRQLVSVARAAAMLDCSSDTIRRTFKDRLVRISPRRVGVRLADVLNLGDQQS